MRTVSPVLTGTIWDELVAGLAMGVVLHDAAGAVLAANRRATELLEVAPLDLLNGQRPDGWAVCDESGSPLPQVAELSAQVITAGIPATGPFVVTLHGVVRRRLWAEIFPVPMRGACLLVSVLHPVQTDLRRSKGLLDPLTGLPNRALLFDRLEQALVRARTHGIMASVVLADLRGLGRINTNRGFAGGDQLISQVARRLRAELREDHTVARYAGGTFAVVADHPHGTGEPISERIRTIAQRRVTVGRDPLRPSVRTSFATSDGNTTCHELIRLAESRLRT
jgi:diguanylate cyclase (GGDEF)-like protein